MPINYSKSTASNKPYGVPGQAVAYESYFYDETTFTFRPYNSIAEVLSYLDTSASRKGNKSIFVLLDNKIEEYWFKDGILDNDLIKKSSSSIGIETTDGIVKTEQNDITTLSLGNITPDSITTTGNVSAQNVSGNNTGDETYQTIINKIGYTPENIANKNQANGYASLDSSAKIPTSQLPDSIIGSVKYKGTYDGTVITSTHADLNNQPLPAASNANLGYYFIVTSSFVLNSVDYNSKDYIISNGTEGWTKIDNTDGVSTVFNRTGNILPIEADYASFYPKLNLAYNDPTWINTLAFSKLTGKPTTLSGYGITDAFNITTNQTVGGVKTLTDNPIITNTEPKLSLVSTGDNNNFDAGRTPLLNTAYLENKAVSAGGLGSAVVWSGTNSYGTFNDTGTPKGNTPMTMMAWFNTTTNDGGAVRILIGNNYNGGTNVSGANYIGVNSGRVRAVINGISSGSSGAVISDGRWHLGLFTFDGVNSYFLYVDNNQVASGTNATSAPNQSTNGILGGAVGVTGAFIGKQDQSAIWNRVLTTAERTAIWNNGNGTASLPTNGLVARFEFDNASGTIATNSASANNATLTNATWDANGFISGSGSSSITRFLRNTDGVSNTDESITSVGAYAGQTELAGRYVTAYIASKKVWTIDQLGHMALDPNGVLSRGTNNSNYPFTNFFIGAGTTNISQIQLADNTVDPIFSINTAGGFHRNGPNLFWNNGTNWTPLNTGYTIKYTASGNGSSTSIVIPHGLTGITTNSGVIIEPNNAASAGRSYSTIDATNITIVFPVAPVTGTNNLVFTINIKP